MDNLFCPIACAHIIPCISCHARSHSAIHFPSVTDQQIEEGTYVGRYVGRHTTPMTSKQSCLFVPREISSPHVKMLVIRAVPCRAVPCHIVVGGIRLSISFLSILFIGSWIFSFSCLFSISFPFLVSCLFAFPRPPRRRRILSPHPLWLSLRSDGLASWHWRSQS